MLDPWLSSWYLSIILQLVTHFEAQSQSCPWGCTIKLVNFCCVKCQPTAFMKPIPILLMSSYIPIYDFRSYLERTWSSSRAESRQLGCDTWLRLGILHLSKIQFQFQFMEKGPISPAIVFWHCLRFSFFTSTTYVAESEDWLHPLEVIAPCEVLSIQTHKSSHRKVFLKYQLHTASILLFGIAAFGSAWNNQSRPDFSHGLIE